MANTKTGLSYYNVDTDRYQDIRIKRLKKDKGCSGIAIYDYILCQIYRDKGSFIIWDESTVFDAAEYFGVDENVVKDAVQYCGYVGLFSKELLSRGIVSSLTIQNRYMEMCIRAKRSNIFIPEFVKLTEESPIITEESRKLTEESQKTTEVCRKVKKSKVKKSIPPIIPPLKSGGKIENSSVIDLKFIENEDFKKLFIEWMEHRKTIKKAYKTQKQCEIGFAELLKKGGGDLETCRDIVYNSIGNGYQGLFEPKTTNYAANQRINAAGGRRTTPEQFIAAVENGCNRAERERSCTQ